MLTPEPKWKVHLLGAVFVGEIGSEDVVKLTPSQKKLLGYLACQWLMEKTEGWISEISLESGVGVALQTIKNDISALRRAFSKDCIEGDNDRRLVKKLFDIDVLHYLPAKKWSLLSAEEASAVLLLPDETHLMMGFRQTDPSTGKPNCPWIITAAAKIKELREEVKRHLLSLQAIRNSEHLFLSECADENTSLQSAAEETLTNPSFYLSNKEANEFSFLPSAGHCIGREDEVSRVVNALLEDPPQPIAILGVEGVGKSTLSLQALHADSVILTYNNRRFFVRCDGSTTINALINEIGRHIGLAAPGLNRQSVLLKLADSRAVLVLDNAETTFWSEPQATEEFFSQLAAIPTLAFIASIRGNERPQRVPWQETIRLKRLSIAASEEIFHKIAGNNYCGDPYFRLLLRQLEGIPLLITLMASLAEGESTLENIWKLWQKEKTDMLNRGEGGRRDLSARVSFETTINSERMTVAAKRLLSLIALLPDGVSFEDIPEVFGDSRNSTALKAAMTLQKVALAYEDGPRLRLLAPLREHIQRHHIPATEDVERFLTHYLELVKREGPQVGSKGGGNAAHRLAPEAANLEIILTKALEAPDPVSGIEATIALTSFTRFSGLGSTRNLGLAAVAAHSLGKTKLEADCTWGLALISLERCNYEESERYYLSALDLYVQAEDKLGQANCIRGLGRLALLASRYDIAKDNSWKALPLYEELGDDIGQAKCYLTLAHVYRANGENEMARGYYQTSLKHFVRVERIVGQGNCWLGLAEIEFSSSNWEEVRNLCMRAFPMYQNAGHGPGEAYGLFITGKTFSAESNFQDALDYFQRSEAFHKRLGNLIGIAACLQERARIMARTGEVDEAKTLHIKAIELFTKLQQASNIKQTYTELCNLALNNEEREDYLHECQRVLKNLNQFG